MADKRITNVDFVSSLDSDESFFINKNNTLKQISKSNIVFDIVNGGTGASNAEDARVNLGAASVDDLNNFNNSLNTALEEKVSNSEFQASLDKKMDVITFLWENNDSDKSFGAQTIYLDDDLSLYDHFLVDFCDSEPSSILKNGANYVTKTNITSTEVNDIVVELMKRKITFYNDRVEIGNNLYSMYTLDNNKFSEISNVNSFLKPKTIYGMKCISNTKGES